MPPRQLSITTATSSFFRKLCKECKAVELQVPYTRTYIVATAPPSANFDESTVPIGHGRYRNKLCKVPIRQLRLTSTILPSSEEPQNFIQHHPQSTFQPQLPIDNPTANDRVSQLPPPNVFVTQQVRDIFQNVRIGQMTYEHIKLILNEAFELCRIYNKRAPTKRENIASAELLIQRLIQEIQYWHIDHVEVQQQQLQSTKPNEQHTSHLIRSLGSIWHYIILGSSHLQPPVGEFKNKPNKQSKADMQNSVTSAESNTEQPYITTGRLLTQMLQLHYQYPSIYPPPTATLYNAWLYSCYTCSSVSDNALHTAEAIIRNLERSTQIDDTADNAKTEQTVVEILPPPPNIPKPTKGMYNHVILIHADRAGHIYGAAVQAEDWLMRMSKVGVIPTTDTFNRVLKAWAESPEKEGGNRAADVLHLMIKLSDEASNVEHGNEIAPNEISFGTVVSAFLKRQQPEACQFILEEALSYYATHKERRRHIADLNECWNTTLFGWSKSGRSDAPDRVEALFNDGIWIQNQHFKVTPTKSTYVACMEAHMKSDRPDRIDQAEKYLRIMVESMRRYKGQSSIENVKPTCREFDFVIHSWFRSLHEFENIGFGANVGKYPIGYTATKASNLLHLMIALQEEGHSSCTPSHGSFHMCIESWTKTAGTCLTAEKNARKVIKRNAISNDTAVNDESTELSIKYRETMKKHAMHAADQAIELLKMAEDRKLCTDSSYAVIIHLLCRIPDPRYAFVAAEVLERYERKTDELNLQWQSEKVWMYNMVTAALNAVGTLQAAEVALQMLRRIPQSGKRSIDKNKIWIYTGVLTAFAKHPGPRAGAVAKELFVDLIAAPVYKPELNNSINLDFCERVLLILAEANSLQSAGDACDVMNTIFDLYFSKRSKIEPSRICFNGCILALTTCRDEKYTAFAIQLLKGIINKFENNLLSHLPSKSAFEQIIHNCNAIGTEEMMQHAKEITILAEKYGTS
jgi:hypothetical protein